MEQILPYIWPLFQTAVVLVGMGIAYGALRSRLDKVEAAVSTMQVLMVAMARQDERVAAMDQRMIAQGQRIDSTTALIASTAQLIDGRMNAINNIVAGHTAALNNMSRGSA